LGMTMAEKILARASGRDEVKANEYVTAKVDVFLAGEKAKLFEYMAEIGIEAVWDPERIVVVTDHRIPSPNVSSALNDSKLREAVKTYGITYWYDVGRGGICHQVLAERGHALPGELIVGQDSHTTTHGALNAAATAIDLPESVLVAAKGETWFRVPETVRFRIDGRLPRLVTSKDVLLKIAGEYGCDLALYRSIEYTGSAVEEMSVASRMTIANMSVDIGAKFALFEADQTTLNYLQSRAIRAFKPVTSDDDAVFAEEYVLNVTSLEPQVACPHNIDNVKPASTLEKAKISISQAFLGSCTNGRFEDLAMAAEILKGNQLHPDVRMIVIPASMSVYQEAMEAGLLDVFLKAEAVVCNPTCGPCPGAHMGLLAPGERCVASSNRNFMGRMGSPASEVYLASPATVAASAIAGYIVDPRRRM